MSLLGFANAKWPFWTIFIKIVKSMGPTPLEAEEWPLRVGLPSQVREKHSLGRRAHLAHRLENSVLGKAFAESVENNL